MTHKFDVKSLLLGAVLGAIIVLAVAATNASRPVWQYHIIYGRLSATTDLPSIGQQLDQAAANGWEVAAACTDNGSPVVILRQPR